MVILNNVIILIIFWAHLNKNELIELTVDFGTYIMCPRSSDPFYIVTYYMKWGSLLLGHTV